KLPGSSEALGGVDNKRAIIRYYNKAESVARSLGKDYNDATRLVEEVTSSLRTLGYSAALGSVDQFAKQYAPVALNTAMNLGGDFGLFFSHINKPGEATPLLEMYTIGQRGKRLGGVERGESTRYKIQSKYRSKILKAVGKVHKLSDKMASVLMASLQKGDVSVAERSWIAYYLKSLKDQGVDLKTVDMSTEHTKQDDEIRKKAAAYAEQAVKVTQVVSNPEELPAIMRTQQGAETWLKNIIIPFSSFAVNNKARVIESIRQVRTNPDSGEAVRQLAGVLLETALFGTMKYFILSQVWKLVRNGVRNLFDLGDEEDEDFKFRAKQLYSGIYKELVPFAVGQVGESAATEMANRIAYLFARPDVPYRKWKDAPIYQYKDHKGGLDLGLYSVSIERVQNAIEDMEMVRDLKSSNTVTKTTPWGDREVNLSEDEKNFLIFMT